MTTIHDLTPVSESEVLPALRELVHTQFVALVDQAVFPCLGGKAAMQRETYLFNLYRDLRTEDSIRRLRQDLRYFTESRTRMGTYCTFAASFVEPADSGTEDHWYNVVWTFLQRLRDHDVEDGYRWDDRFSRDPRNGEFALSQFGCGYLLVALYPGAWRYARRFAWPTIIFNPAEQDHLNFPEHRRFLNFRDTIRARDALLQGASNPSLPPTQDYTQATGFAGVRTDPETWQCPIDLRVEPLANKPHDEDE